MKSVIALTWIAILMCSSGEDGFLRDSVNDNRLEDLLHEILRSTNTRDVFILIQNHRNDHIATQIISTVFETVSKLLPTISIDVMQKSKSPDDLATSDTLLIYLYASRVNLESEFWEQIVSNLLDVSLGSHAPKILFLLVEDESDTYIEDFYKYLWTQKMIRVEILEILSSMNLMIAHRYNPFSNNYTKKYDSLDSLAWYSDKVKNMHKQPMCCQTMEELNMPSSHSLSESYFRLMILTVLSRKMNFNYSVCNDISEADVYPPRYNYLPKLDDTVDYINVFSNTDVCLITPILPAKTVILWNFFSTICLGAAIVIVFLVASKLLQIDERLQRVMYLINVLLGFSITLLPTTSSEKVLFLSVVTVSSMYTTMFYTEIFELAFVHRVYEIDDFEDLARSGLSVMIDEAMYPEFMNSSEIPWSVKRKMLPWKVTYDENILGLEPRANTSYFFEYQIAEMFAKWRRDAYGQHLFKLNKLCVEIRSVLLTLKKRSPYKERVEDVAMRMVTAGFFDYVKKIMSTVFTVAHVKNKTVAERKFAISFALVILFCGLFVSFLVFLGEVIISKRSQNMT